MSNRFGSLKKEMKRMSKQLNSDKGLMLKKTFDTSASLYGNGKENKPYVTLNIKGDFKISILKLAIILIFVLSTMALVMICAKNFIWHRRFKKPRGAKNSVEYRDEEWV